jgi:hypothetical protein
MHCLTTRERCYWGKGSPFVEVEVVDEHVVRILVPNNFLEGLATSRKPFKVCEFSNIDHRGDGVLIGGMICTGTIRWPNIHQARGNTLDDFFTI